MAVETRGVLFEYGFSLPPLMLIFTFNPQEISRSRTVTVKTGDSPASRGGYDFLTPLETSRVAQGVEVQAESFSITILLDATDAMAEGHPIVTTMGVQPQIDTLRSMAEPKVQGPAGLQVLSSLGGGGDRAFERQETASVLVFAWGAQLLPVFLTGVTQKETLHLPNLFPYRAEIGLTMQVMESAPRRAMARSTRRSTCWSISARTRSSSWTPGAAGSVTVRADGPKRLKPGERVSLALEPAHIHQFGADGLALQQAATERAPA